MNKRDLLIIIFIISVFFILYKKQENFGNSQCSCTTQSNQAIQNIRSIYANKDGTVTFNNVRITGKLEVDGSTQLNNLNAQQIGTSHINTSQINGSNWYINGTEMSIPNINTSHINGSNWYINGTEMSIPNISSTTINGPLNVNGNISTKATGNTSYNLYTGTVYTNTGTY